MHACTVHILFCIIAVAGVKVPCVWCHPYGCLCNTSSRCLQDMHALSGITRVMEIRSSHPVILTCFARGCCAILQRLPRCPVATCTPSAVTASSTIKKHTCALLACHAAAYAGPLDAIKDATSKVTGAVDKTVNGTKTAVNSVTNGE